jgi:hypothetical protein
MKRATFTAAGMAVWLAAIYLTGTQQTRAALGAIASNLAVQLVLGGAAVVFLLSLCAAAWERSERRFERDQARRQAERLEVERHVRSLRVQNEIASVRAELGSKGYAVLPANFDTSSLLDDPPQNDRGPRAA